MYSSDFHRYLVGLESAEERAERERLIGWDVGIIDPGVDPSDYDWRIEGDDVLCFCCEDIDQSYLHRLVLTLLRAGASFIGVFDKDGRCLFGRFSSLSGHDENLRAA